MLVHEMVKASKATVWSGILLCALAASVSQHAGALPIGSGAQQAAQSSKSPEAPGTPFSGEKLSSLLPPSVYFAGRTAPLQLRNAGGVRFADGSILWVSLVDSSGYSSAVQDRYQFYLVTEGPVHFGEVMLKAGAYGGGFVGDKFVLMDLGDHPVGEGPTQTDATFQRPRPLQILEDQPNAVKLYLGRRWVTLRSQPQ